MKGLVGGAAQGADCRRNWTSAFFRGVRALELIPPVRSVPVRPESPGVEGATNWRAMREQGEHNRYRFDAPRQTVANECSWSYW